jgi:hypothetical protein
MQEQPTPCSTVAVSLVTSSRTTSPLCPCYRLGQAAQLMTIGPITIVTREFGTHQPGCRFYDYNNGASVERRRSLLLSANHGDSWNASLMRFVATTSSFLAGVICTTRFVDGDKRDAPGFKHISNAWNKIRSALGAKYGTTRSFLYRPPITKEELQHCRSILAKLHNALETDFHRSRDWAYIQTLSGETLLHVSTNIFKKPSLGPVNADFTLTGIQ